MDCVVQLLLPVVLSALWLLSSHGQEQKKSGSLRSFNKDLITGLDKKLKNQTLTVTDVHTSSKRTPSRVSMI